MSRRDCGLFDSTSLGITRWPRSIMSLLLGLAALMPGLGSASGADPYPSRPVRLVVGYGAGGSVDVPARYIADQLSVVLGQRVIVENKPGAAGMLAARDVLSQPRDGYHLLLCTHFESINTLVYKNVLYKLSDFAPISLIAKYYYALTIPNSIPAETFEQFVQYARARPGALNYSTVGAGSGQEFLMRRLERLVGVTMSRIPFRGGPEIAQELIAGRIHFYIAPTIAVMSHYESRQVKILALTSPDRLGSAPEIPTLREAGIDLVRFGWLGVCAAAGTPPAIIERLNRAVTSIVATPGYRAMIEGGGQIAVSSTPDELARVMIQTADDDAPIVREFGMQQD